MTYQIGNVLDVLPTLAAGRFRCCVTSPPYWGLRDYGHADQLGLEPTPAEYVERMVRVFREVRRVLADDGTCWINIGDSYASGEVGRHDAIEPTSAGPTYRALGAAQGERKQISMATGLAAKNLVGIPWRLAFALQSDGWYLRSDIIWSKPNPMPESVTDRPTKAHEYVFLLSKSARYFYDAAAVAERSMTGMTGMTGGAYDAPGSSPHSNARGDVVSIATDTRNARTVWTIASQPYEGAHFATMPPALAERCILAGSAIGDEVLDPFLGSGTTGQVAEALGRQWFGVELQPDYEPLIKARTAQVGLFGRTA
mgnify:CR=1 FL=1